ncbi:MAG: DUF6036 family nucleotidyltransferase [Alphaproteobacteria bacterium]
MIVGGYALAVHGHPRYTKDIDVWILIDHENARKIIQTLNDFGFSELRLTEEDFLTPGNVIQLGYPPNRIDIITQATGVDFKECYSKKLQVEIDGLKINIIDIENLKKNKRATGRLQDLADIEKLEE